MTNLDSILKSKDITLTKVHILKAVVLPVVSYGWMWELGQKEDWVPKNWYFQTVVLEKTLESPWTVRPNQSIPKEINPEYALKVLMLQVKGEIYNIQYTPFANTLATWCEEPTHWKRSWCWEGLRAKEKGLTEDEMVEWHDRLNEHEFEQTPGDSEGQGSLTCCSPWGRRESDPT